MSKFELVISKHAADSIQKAYAQAKETSLIGAEDLRTALVSRLHQVASNPLRESQVVEGTQLPGDLRTAKVRQFKVFFLVQASRVIVIDLVVDAGKPRVKAED